jgi:hypothetical protein
MCALFRTGTSDGLLWRRQRTFLFHKMRGVSQLALELLVSQEGAGTVGLVIWLDGTEFAELPQVLHTATTFSFLVMIGCCLKFGCIHLFIIKLLVSFLFCRSYLCTFPLFHLPLSLGIFFVKFCFFSCDCLYHLFHPLVYLIIFLLLCLLDPRRACIANLPWLTSVRK